MARPKKIVEPQEESYVKVQRVMGQKVTRIMDCEYWRQFPEIYDSIMRYNIEEIPYSIFKEIYGVRLIENQTEIEQIEKVEE